MMTNGELENHLVQDIENHSGGMEFEILARCADRYAEDTSDGPNPRDIVSNYASKALDKLVKEGRLIEIEYTLLDRAIKSFYLPKVFSVRVIHGDSKVLIFSRIQFDNDSQKQESGSCCAEINSNKEHKP